MPRVIEVKNLVKRYRKADTNAVDDISFSVNAGEFFALLGPNGAGKTTTISILTTTLAKTSGIVTIAGRDIDRGASAVRKNIGVIFQQPSLDLNLTAEENVRLHANLYGLYPFRPWYGLMPEQYKKRVHELANVLGITDALFDPIKTFSGGMRRKLEIIRSLMHRPAILFLDEPTTGLDPVSRKNLWEYLQQMRSQERTTIFLTTHYLDEAENADRICIIDHGKIISLGTPAETKKGLIAEYLLIDAKDRKALRSELTHLGLAFTAADLFQVSLGNKTAYQIVKELRTPLTVLKIHNPTLEEAYLEMIQKEIRE
ncbi:MAG: ATP-binding cassette domain-containing protein [Candidatus Sungbacteria bacterium]|nr:ATP-binding cassette domain-containing protein [Candidatus Sungbacteria bacterium]